MKTNMGSLDRISRILLAAVMSVLYFTSTVTGVLGIVLFAVSGIFVITGLVGFCPLYTLVGFNTCASKKE
jgi:uncharacterized membrane protein